MGLLTALLITTTCFLAVSNVALSPGTSSIVLPRHAQQFPPDSTSFNPSMRPSTAFWDDDLASPADFTRYASKGGALMCAMSSTDLVAGHLLRDTRSPPSATSIWTGDLKAELHEWYWRAMAPSSKGCRLNEFWAIPATLKALGLKGEGGDNMCVRLEHWDVGVEDDEGRRVPAINQWYEVGGGEKFRATKAHFEFIVNVNGGAIYALYLDSPKSSARTEWYGNKKDADPALLPRLRSFSDIVWGYWVRDNPNVKNVRYFFMLGISNDQTNQVIASCLQKKGKTLSEWPGLTVRTETDEGKALLGSPNGATFAYFLLQHKAQLGYKTISKITIVRPETDDDNDFVDASLVFHVADAPDPPPDEDAEGGGKVKEKRVDSYDYAVEVLEESRNEITRVHRFDAQGRSD